MNSLTVSWSLLLLIAFVQAPARYLLEMLKAESREIVVKRHRGERGSNTTKRDRVPAQWKRSPSLTHLDKHRQMPPQRMLG